MSRKAYGFTIVELLIVIVVIGILAAISIVAYNNIQQRANDTRIREGAAQFEKALNIWSIDNGSTVVGNSGSTAPLSGSNCSSGGGEGWVSSGRYHCTTEDVLVAANLLPAGYVSKLPKNTHYSNPSNGIFSLMLYRCSPIPNTYILFWTLQSPTSEDASNLSSILTQCGRNTSIPDSYGMRAAKLIRLST